MPRFQKAGANIDLKGLVIHQVIKNAGVKKATLKVANNMIIVGDKERVFISKVNKAYFKKSNPTYGIFGNEYPKFKDSLKEYLKKNDFLGFTAEALKQYKLRIEDVASATGGFIIFAHYFNTDIKHDYLLVLTINNKDGYSLSETKLTIEDIKNLDLAKIDVACMINLTKWDDIEANGSGDGITYLSFVRGNKDISRYFMEFIDCADKTTGSESSRRLTSAIKSYCEEIGLNKKERIKLQNEIYDYCTDRMNHKEEIQLSVISAMINPEYPEDFQEFAGAEEYGVSAIISGDRAKLKTMRYTSYKGDNIRIEFDNSLIGKNIIVNKKTKELTIKNLPQELMDQIP